MKAVLNFIVENQASIIFVTGLVISEVMALNPKWKYNGILQLILNVLNKAGGRK